MARAGVYFSDVKRARDALIAEGRYPSIDAVRAAMGNTGSKTTIHRFLRELEAEEGGQKAPVSDAILTLVTQLTSQLQSEAATEVEAIRTQMEEQQAAYDRLQTDLGTQLVDVRQALDAVRSQLNASQQEVATFKDQLGTEKTARRTAEQRNIDLGERLADAQQHQASLEEKHRHARDALEHYRSASKEQREQESRRHEHQVQALQVELRQVQLAASLKQEELTRLNKEAATLATELGASKQALYLEREAGRNLARRVEQLQPFELRVGVLEAQLAEIQVRVLEAEQRSNRAAELCKELRQQKVSLEVELASMRSAIKLEDRLAKLDQAVFGTEAFDKPGSKSI